MRCSDSTRRALGISILFAAASAAWLLFSVHAASAGAAEDHERDESIRSIGYVAISSVALGLILRRQFRKSSESSRQFSKIFLQNPSLIAIVRQSDRTIVDVNEAFLRATGFAREELRGRTLASMSLYPVALADDLTARVRREGHVENAELRICTRTGEHRDLLLSIEPIEFQGEPCLLGTATDITARRNLELAMRRWAHAFEHCAHGIAMGLPGSNTVLTCNPALARLLGRDEKTLASMPIVELYAPEDRSIVVAGREQSDREGRARYEARMLRDDGSTFLAQTDVVTVRDESGAPLYRIATVQDISATRAVEARFRALIEHAPDGIVLVSQQGRMLFASPSALRVFGRDDFNSIDPMESTHPDDRSLLFSIFEQLLADPSRVLTARYRFRVADGSWIWVESIFTNLLGVPGIDAYVINFRDITERKRYEDELAASQLVQRAILDNMPDPAWMKDREGRTIAVNRAWLELSGRAEAQVLGRRDHEIFDAERARVWEDRDRRIMERGVAERFDEHFRDAGGRVRSFDTIKAPVNQPDGSPLGTIGIAREITGRLAAEEALRASEERYRALVETSFDWVWEVDAEGRYTYASPRVRDLLGYEPAEIIGRTPFDFMPPDEAERVGRAFLDFVHRREAFSALENTNLHRDGREVVLESSGLPVYDANGEFRGYRGMDRDVTARRRLEIQFRQAQKMEAVGRLAGGVAHDFNNILQAIFGYCEILIEGMPEANGLRREVLEIQNSAARAARLTRQLLAFSRRQLIQPVPMDVNQLVASTESMLRRLIGEDIALETRLDSHLGTVRADPGSIEQVVINLVVNARDAMPKGGHIVIATANVAISPDEAEKMPGARAGGFIRLSVQDDGCGMDAETVQHIFEPFFSTKGPDKGTGLGLSVIYGIAQQHDGWVNVASEVGHGSVFNLYLPAISAPSEVISGVERSAAPPTLPMGRGERILVLEDDHAVRFTLFKLLARAGYQIMTTSCVTEAIQTFEREAGRFDLFFTDVVLPDGNGFDVAERFHALNAHMAIVLSSGYTDERARWADSASQGFGFIQKPYVAGDLLPTIRRALDARPGQ